MNDEATGYDVADIEDDERVLESITDELNEFFSVELDVYRGDLEEAKGVGGRYVAQRGTQVQRRYRALLHHEYLYELEPPPEDDYSLLIFAAGRLVETGLEELLTGPAREHIADEILEVLASEPKLALTVERWKEGRLLPTIGIQCNVLLALRRGLTRVPISEFLRDNFKKEYVDILSSNGLARSLSQVRDVRNRAGHVLVDKQSEEPLDGRSYQQVARLLVGSDCFRAWDRRGPENSTADPTIGVLHHHLSLSLRDRGDR